VTDLILRLVVDLHLTSVLGVADLLDSKLNSSNLEDVFLLYFIILYTLSLIKNLPLSHYLTSNFEQQDTCSQLNLSVLGIVSREPSCPLRFSGCNLRFPNKKSGCCGLQF